MSITVRRAELWRTENPNTPGSLAAALKPLAECSTDLEIVMGYASADRTSMAIEVSPVRTASERKAAREAGLARSSYPCVVIAGDNRPGIGYEVGAALAAAGIQINFFVAQSLGDRYTGLFSFEAAAEADLAVQVVSKALFGQLAVSTHKRKPAAAKPARRTAKRPAKRK